MDELLIYKYSTKKAKLYSLILGGLWGIFIGVALFTGAITIIDYILNLIVVTSTIFTITFIITFLIKR